MADPWLRRAEPEGTVTGANIIVSEDLLILAWVVLTQYQHVTDRQRDRRTVRHTSRRLLIQVDYS